MRKERQKKTEKEMSRDVYDSDDKAVGFARERARALTK